MKSVLGDRRAIFLLLAPALTVYSLIILIPVFWSLGYTVFEGNAINGFSFVGLDNIKQLFSDPDVHQALWFTVRFALVLTAVQVALGYLLALLYVFVLRKASNLIRTLVFFPVVLPTVAVSLLFQQLFEYAPRNGPVNSILNVFGIPSVDWFGTSTSSFWVLILMETWRSMGFYAVLLYAGLVDIPEEVLESSRLDGASGLRLVRHIVIPLSMPVLLSSIIFSINGTLKIFDSVIALTNGGPGTSTTPLTVLMFQTSFGYGEYGYGSAIALLLTMLCLIVTIFIFRSSRRDLTKA
ncbi:sugar ABC transporter permease [Cellulomonas sp. JH27-2]|uniref:carbohydrate ABC transporter permease n=1 Tax=Cellulomonas sp. JH27-2 TaxID=2774139 RepID=UPI0017814AE8|nr:sugar ABC transporter permease [Cellulomonas sp. JH27-2]MBD8059196.1 sugar ABC transporter permease [Cellulomonas sp. JH27-2]